MKKIIISLIMVLVVNLSTKGQYLNPQSIKSPNVASMERFGDIPVNLFTGTPDISVPLNKIKYGDIEIPIGLRYHASSVKPTQAPGWIGLGWDLECNGAISRQVRGHYDEWTYLPPSSYGSIIGYFDGGASNVENNSNWFNADNMYQQNNDQNFSDQEADEFSFNFLGHSGKFYYSGPTKGWVVVSDETIKIEVNGFLLPMEYIEDALYQYVTANNQTNRISDWAREESRFFREFTLITSDGTRYTFGGINAVEFTSSYRAQYATAYESIDLSSWLLKKIEDINGKIITYTYKRDYPNISLFHYCNSYSSSYNGQNWISTGTGMSTIQDGSFSVSELINTNRLAGRFIFPMYLTSIENDIELVTFESVPATTLNYSETQISSAGHQWDDMWEQYGSPSSIPTDSYYYQPGWIPNLKWNKLININVKDKLSNSNVNKYTFEYFENANQRFSLSKLNVIGTDLVNYKNYEFLYDNIAALPIYGGNYIDHWGFFNNTDIGSSLSTAFSNRQTNPNTVTKGLLSRIKYPTGGFTDFVWEAHKHSRVLSENKNTLINYDGFAGGSRIREINSYSDIGILSSQKKYYYVTGYDTSSNPNLLTSSGVLNGIPRYNFSFSNYFGMNNNTIFGYSLFSLNSIANYNPTGNGSHIGYDEVVEVNLDNSYTKHYFTNYGTDINGVTHFDQLPLGYTGWHLGDQTVYMAYSSLERERGKEILVYDFDSQNNLVKKTKNIFRSDPARFNEFIKQKIKFADFSVMGDALMFAVAIKNFTYNYYPVGQEITNYLGTNPIVSTKFFSYNAKNQLSIEQKTTSNQSNTYQTKYFYPCDTQVSTEPNASSLCTKNIINTPLKTENYYNTQLLSSQITKFDVFTSVNPLNSLYLPKYIWTKKGNVVPDQLEKKVTYNYDNNGNIIEYTLENGLTTYLIWGYNKTQLIAKIENNASIVIPTTTITNLQALSNADNDHCTTIPCTGNEEILRVALNNLRATYPNAIITTYTYDPLIGVTSITDAKGDRMTYEYDALNRLKWVKDKNGNILSQNQYHYKN